METSEEEVKNYVESSEASQKFGQGSTGEAKICSYSLVVVVPVKIQLVNAT